jgi:predicted transposase/invertase (TIGR01784 family)
MYSSQMKEGMDYGELCKTITINIVNFHYLSHISDYHSTFQLYEREQKLLLTDMLEIHFMELPKLLIKWRNREVDPREDQVFTKAMDEWERVSQDPEVLLAYEARRKALLDEKSALKRAETLGEKKGKEETLKKVALGMIEKGLDDSVIVELTGFTPEEIEKLRHQ